MFRIIPKPAIFTACRVSGPTFLKPEIDGEQAERKTRKKSNFETKTTTKHVLCSPKYVKLKKKEECRTDTKAPMYKPTERWKE